MAITLDATSTPASSGAQISFSHTAAATVRGIVIGIVQNGDFSDQVTSVTWGGALVPRLRFTGYTGVQAGAVYSYLLGANVAVGLQTCVINVNGTGSIKRCALWSLNGASNMNLVQNTIDSTINGVLADPSAVLAIGGFSSWCNIVFFSGQDDPTGITPLVNWTATGEHDFGLQTAGWYRYNIIGTADVTAGWTQTIDDAAAIALAVKESLAPNSAISRNRGMRK